MLRRSLFGIEFERYFEVPAMKSIVLAFLLMCSLTMTALGQVTTGSLSGTVSDPSGAIVPGATVTLVNNATGAERSAISNSTGTFDFQALQPGTYTISVDARGFRHAVARDIVVSVASSAQV